MAKKVNIRTDGMFLNADAGFDSRECRQICKNYQIEANIDFNTRNGLSRHRFEYFDNDLYQNRFVIERAFIWLDVFKALLIRFEQLQLIGYV